MMEVEVSVRDKSLCTLLLCCDAQNVKLGMFEKRPQEEQNMK
jgi:hypothetical protein